MKKEITQIEKILLEDGLAVERNLDNGFIHTAKAYLFIFKQDLECYKEILGKKSFDYYNGMYKLEEKVYKVIRDLK